MEYSVKIFNLMQKSESGYVLVGERYVLVVNVAGQERILKAIDVDYCNCVDFRKHLNLYFNSHIDITGKKLVLKKNKGLLVSYKKLEKVTYHASSLNDLVKELQRWEILLRRIFECYTTIEENLQSYMNTLSNIFVRNDIEVPVGSTSFYCNSLCLKYDCLSGIYNWRSEEGENGEKFYISNNYIVSKVRKSIKDFEDEKAFLKGIFKIEWEYGDDPYIMVYFTLEEFGGCIDELLNYLSQTFV